MVHFEFKSSVRPRQRPQPPRSSLSDFGSVTEGSNPSAPATPSNSKPRPMSEAKVTAVGITDTTFDTNAAQPAGPPARGDDLLGSTRRVALWSERMKAVVRWPAPALRRHQAAAPLS